MDLLEKYLTKFPTFTIRAPSNDILFQHYGIFYNTMTPKSWDLAPNSNTIPTPRVQHIQYTHIFVTLFIALGSSSGSSTLALL